MTSDACQRYCEDPEGNPGHLDDCAECRALFSGLDELPELESRPIDLDSLPLAPWEGADSRPWALVAAGVIVVLAIASALFMTAGVSPLLGMLHAIGSSVPSLDILLTLLRVGPAAIQHAPLGWQVVIGAGFIVVNMLLFALLRRAPRGIDV